MRHISLSLPTLMHIFPFTINAMPPNIFFSSTRGRCASAALTLSAKTASYAIILRLYHNFIDLLYAEQEHSAHSRHKILAANVYTAKQGYVLYPRPRERVCALPDKPPASIYQQTRGQPGCQQGWVGSCRAL